MTDTYSVSASVARRVAEDALAELAAIPRLHENGQPEESPHFWVGRLTEALKYMLGAKPATSFYADAPLTEAVDRLIKDAVVLRATMLGETSPPVSLASLRDAPHYEGLPVLDDDGDDRDDADIAARDAAEADGTEREFLAPLARQPFRISPESIAEAERVGNEWPDGVHTCAELQQLEPGRRPCTCGRCGLAPPHGYTTPAVEVPAKDGTGPAWCGRESHDHTCCDGARAAFGVQA